MVTYYAIVDNFGSKFVYKTIDGGLSWIPTSLGKSVQPKESIYTLKFMDENTGFASGGFNWPQTFKTTDGGTNWQEVNELSFEKIQFLNENLGYAFGHEEVSKGSLYRTLDGGNSWQTILETGHTIEDFDILNDSVGFVVGYGGTIYKTRNGGSSWEELTAPHLIGSKIKFITPSFGYHLASNGELYKTEDGGEHWERLGFYLETWNMELTDTDIYLAGANGKIFKGEITGTVSAIGRVPGPAVDLQLFPNPSGRWFKVLQKGPQGITAITVHDASGKLVVNNTIVRREKSVQVTLPEDVKGVCFVTILLDDQTVVTRKIVVE